MRQISIAMLRRHAGQGNHLFLAGTVAFFALIIGLALIATVNPFLVWRAPEPTRETPAVARPGTEGEMRYGTIQLAPAGSSQCQQIEFDNATGSLIDKGEVACGTALSKPRPRAPSAAEGEPINHADRVEMIRRGFLKR